MNKTFNFEKIDYYGVGRRENAVDVNVEFIESNNKKVFSVCGKIWNRTHTDTLCGGQCLDEIKKYINNPVFLEIYRLWELYHLNDMHPECIHQEKLGWAEMAKRQVPIYCFDLKNDISMSQRTIKSEIIDAVKKNGSFVATKEEQEILNLELLIKSPVKELPDGIKDCYKLKKVETKFLGHLYPSEHPDGILTKSCPVCGYKYGSSLFYREIPTQDEQKIIQLLNG